MEVTAITTIINRTGTPSPPTSWLPSNWQSLRKSFLTIIPTRLLNALACGCKMMPLPCTLPLIATDPNVAASYGACDSEALVHRNGCGGAVAAVEYKTDGATSGIHAKQCKRLNATAIK
jgi:hypothetical protein